MGRLPWPWVTDRSVGAYVHDIMSLYMTLYSRTPSVSRACAGSNPPVSNRDSGDRDLFISLPVIPALAHPAPRTPARARRTAQRRVANRDVYDCNYCSVSAL